MHPNIALLCGLILGLGTGCTTVYEAQGPPQPAKPTADHTVVNNTRYNLNVLQDGRIIFTGLEPGQAVPVRARIFGGTSVVIVTGYTAEGKYVGTAQWTFIWNLPEAWTVSYLIEAR